MIIFLYLFLKLRNVGTCMSSCHTRKVIIQHETRDTVFRLQFIYHDTTCCQNYEIPFSLIYGALLFDITSFFTFSSQTVSTELIHNLRCDCTRSVSLLKTSTALFQSILIYWTKISSGKSSVSMAREFSCELLKN